MLRKKVQKQEDLNVLIIMRVLYICATIVLLFFKVLDGTQVRFGNIENMRRVMGYIAVAVFSCCNDI